MVCLYYYCYYGCLHNAGRLWQDQVKYIQKGGNKYKKVFKFLFSKTSKKSQKRGTYGRGKGLVQSLMTLSMQIQVGVHT